MNYSSSGSSVCGILQARILEWVAIPSPGGSSQSRDWTQVFCIVGRPFSIWATIFRRHQLDPKWGTFYHKPCQWSSIIKDKTQKFSQFRRKQRSNCQHPLDHWKSTGVPEKHLFLLYWLCQSLGLCGSEKNCGKYLKRWEYQTT